MVFAYFRKNPQENHPLFYPVLTTSEITAILTGWGLNMWKSHKLKASGLKFWPQKPINSLKVHLDPAWAGGDRPVFS
jgi:hypothetical protein